MQFSLKWTACSYVGVCEKQKRPIDVFRKTKLWVESAVSFTGALLFEVLNVYMLNTRFYEKTTLLIGPFCNVNIRSLPVVVFNVQDAKM